MLIPTRKVYHQPSMIAYKACSPGTYLENTLWRSFFLSDPVRPVGVVEDVDGVDDAKLSVIYAPTGP